MWSVLEQRATLVLLHDALVLVRATMVALAGVDYQLWIWLREMERSLASMLEILEDRETYFPAPAVGPRPTGRTSRS